MAYSSTSRKQGAKGGRPPSPPTPPAPQIPAEPASASLRTIALDDSEHFLHNHHASVATLRLLFTFAPECRSASLRNRCSPSPEYSDENGRALLSCMFSQGARQFDHIGTN